MKVKLKLHLKRYAFSVFGEPDVAFNFSVLPSPSGPKSKPRFREFIGVEKLTVNLLTVVLTDEL